MSQAYGFLIAGFDMLGIISMFTAMDLAVNTAVQERARDEVTRLAAKHSGLTFDALREMCYLENVIKGTYILYGKCYYVLYHTNEYQKPIITFSLVRDSFNGSTSNIDSSLALTMRVSSLLS